MYFHYGKGITYFQSNYFIPVVYLQWKDWKKKCPWLSLSYGTFRLTTCLSNMQLSKPRKVPIPERYVESDPDEPLSPEELEERSRRAERIKNLLAKSR